MIERAILTVTLDALWRDAYEHLRAVYPPGAVPAWADLSEEDRAFWRYNTNALHAEAAIPPPNS